MVDASDAAEQVRERWGLPAERVALVRPGVWHPSPLAPEALATLRARFGIPERFLLYVGALERRKGLDVLLEAYAAARADGLASGLVLVGDGELRDSLSGPGVVLTGRLTDADLGGLYGGARATVLPSLLEGFGFTPLESLAAGTPAVTSDLPSVRETLGDAGMFVTPGDARALAAALLEIDGDDALRRRLAAAGRAAVDALSWERAADEAVAVLTQAKGR
jgi:glycosyltransferase involved in cell wall biosynthesis